MHHRYHETGDAEGVDLHLPHREGCVPFLAEVAGYRFMSCTETARCATLCGVNYWVWTPRCIEDWQQPLRDVAELLAKLFDFEMGNASQVARIWEEHDERELILRRDAPSLYDVENAALFIKGGYARAYFDLDLVRALAARRAKAACHRCGTTRNLNRQKWRPAGSYDKPMWFCSRSCENKWEDEWRELKEARENLRKARVLVRDPRKLTEERSSFIRKQSEQSKTESRTPATASG